jgi:hypothetical protein
LLYRNHLPLLVPRPAQSVLFVLVAKPTLQFSGAVLMLYFSSGVGCVGYQSTL